MVIWDGSSSALLSRVGSTHGWLSATTPHPAVCVPARPAPRPRSPAGCTADSQPSSYLHADPSRSSPSRTPSVSRAPTAGSLAPAGTTSSSAVRPPSPFWTAEEHPADLVVCAQTFRRHWYRSSSSSAARPSRAFSWASCPAGSSRPFPSPPTGASRFPSLCREPAEADSVRPQVDPARRRQDGPRVAHPVAPDPAARVALLRHRRLLAHHGHDDARR